MAEVSGTAITAGISGLLSCIILICIPAILFYYFWSRIPSVGQAIDSAFGGQMDPQFCVDNACINNCVLWNDIVRRNADYYCYQDHGVGYRSNGQWSQADCRVGSGKTACIQDPARAGLRYWNNCVLWTEMENNANTFCENDLGKGWVYSGIRDQGGCDYGSGKALCRYDPTRADWQRMKNCVAWNEIPNNGNYYCSQDFGSGWVYTGERDQGGCLSGWGKGTCRLDPSRLGVRYQKNCSLWGQQEAAGDSWCINDFGTGWRYIGREQAGCPLGQGRGLCRKT